MADAELNFVDFDAQVSTKDLNAESASFIWLSLLKDVLIQLPHYEHHITTEHDEEIAKRDTIQNLRCFHADNPEQLAKVDEFEEFYDCKEMAVYLYSINACIHQPINIALRTKDIDALIKYRYFISHLCSDLADRCAKYRLDHPHELKFHVYRGQRLSAKEIDRLRNSLQKIVAMNGFFSTSRSRDVATNFAGNVLFHIEIDAEKHPGLIFADIANISEFEEEQEVLFDVSTVFRVEKIEDESDALTCIHLSASSESRGLVDTYLSLQRSEMPEFSLVMMFGRLLCFMGEYSKARKHFEHLLETSGEDKPSLYHNLAFISDKEQNFHAALEYYDLARSLLQASDPPRRQELATTLNNMSTVYSQLGEHKKALQILLESLSIQKEYRPADHIDIASAYNNLGCLYRELGELDQSYQNHRLALDLYRRIGLPTIHPYVADCLHNLAHILHDQDDFDAAQNLYERALEIRRKCQLPTHPDIATNINDIGYVLCDAERPEDGFTYFEQAYDLRIANKNTSRIDLADSFNNMGVVNRYRGNLVSAIDFYKRSIAIYEEALPADHPTTIKVRNNLEIARRLETS